MFIFLPDDKLNWVVSATIKAIYEVKRQQFDCILTSSPPHSVHLIGLLIKKLTNINWFVDFRDPWVDDIPNDKPPFARCTLSDKIEHWMEKQVVQNADRVITTTNILKEVLQNRYKDTPREKFLYIPNGIDTEKFTRKCN